MQILAIDIGGTHCRFAHFEGNQLGSASLAETFIIATESMQSFSMLLQHFEQVSEPPFLSLESYNSVVLSVAGPVTGNICRPPNIQWEVDISQVPNRHSYLINDFVAQAYACLVEKIRQAFIAVKPGKENPDGNLAVIGAGTGLGHCCLSPVKENYTGVRQLIPVASEGGHAQFPFCDGEERDFETFLKGRLEIPYAYGDVVVSGRGLSLIHEYLCHESVAPETVAAKFDKSPKTLEWFARFYARACRNYCLAVYASGGLIISGGVAAKNPGIVTHQAFVEEFVLSPTHEQLLKDIPVYLNRNEDLGLLGAAQYGLLQHP